LIRLKL